MPARVLRIGVVDFLNAWPLWGALENRPGLQLVRGVPSVLAQKLRAGEVDTALISSVEFFRLPPGYVCHDKLCIAAGAEVRSIRFFVAVKGLTFDATLQKLRRIYTDAASRSSVAQLQIILQKLGLEIPLEEISDAPKKIPQLLADEGLLAIGDTALRFRERPSYDLQSEYFTLFERGFVYALWVYRTALQAELEPLLEGAYQNYKAEADSYMAEAVVRFGFPDAFTRGYLQEVIKHELTGELKGDLEFFRRQMQSLPRLKSG